MEIISMDIRTFDALFARIREIEEKSELLSRKNEDIGLKKWLDNEDVCNILGISKRTFAGLPRQRVSCRSAVSETNFSTVRRTLRDYYSRRITQTHHNYEPLFYRQAGSACGGPVAPPRKHRAGARTS